MKRHVQIIGHRGWMSEYPENSLIGFQQAAALGVDGIELDVHMTRDGEIVVHHDETIQRMTNGSGWIRDLTLAELHNFHLRHRFGRRFRKEKIPTLRDVLLSLAHHPNLLINIELKTNVVLYDEIERKTLALVARYAPNHRVVYSSFHLPTLIRLKQRLPEAEVALITSRAFPHMKDVLTTFGIDGIHPRRQVYTKNEASFAALRKVRPWAVNRPRSMKRFLQSDVAAIITKHPDQALRLRAQLK